MGEEEHPAYLHRRQAGQPAELIGDCLDDLHVFTEGERGVEDWTLLAIQRRM